MGSGVHSSEVEDGVTEDMSDSESAALGLSGFSSFAAAVGDVDSAAPPPLQPALDGTAGTGTAPAIAVSREASTASAGSSSRWWTELPALGLTASLDGASVASDSSRARDSERRSGGRSGEGRSGEDGGSEPVSASAAAAQPAVNESTSALAGVEGVPAPAAASERVMASITSALDSLIQDSLRK